MGGRISIGLKVINFKDVLYCKAEGNYTRIFIEKNTFIEAHNLKVMESRLPAELFFRIHK